VAGDLPSLKAFGYYRSQTALAQILLDLLVTSRANVVLFVVEGPQHAIAPGLDLDAAFTFSIARAIVRALESEIGRLDRNQHMRRRHQRVDGNKTQSRGVSITMISYWSPKRSQSIF